MYCATLAGTLCSLMMLIFWENILSIPMSEKGCQISIHFQTGDLKEPQPLILNASFQILYPDETSTLKFSTGQSILLACPNTKNGLDIALKSQQIRGATCIRHKLFRIGGKLYPFYALICKKRFKGVAKKSGTCLNNFSRIEIGFQIPESFISILEICRDNKTHETYYVKSEMRKNIGGYQSKSPRPNWVTHHLFPGRNINVLYTKKNQLKILGMILNSEELAKRYTKKCWLERGHLAAKADFVYGTEQNSTFTFANAAPQWSLFNSGNWKYIESTVRKFVVDNDLKVTIYTGVHGQMTLRDVNDAEQPIYLDIDENNNGYIRVPKFYWKIIYDPVRSLALAIIGVNNPFSKAVTRDMFLCSDISDRPHFTWLTTSWNGRKNISLGFSYVCSYKNLKKTVSTVPVLKVKGILRSYLL